MSFILGAWNEQMHWNLSGQQITDYSSLMTLGVMKKYQTNPEHPDLLYIPDRYQFYREMGESLGFTREEADNFVRARKEYDLKSWQIGDCRNYSSNDPKEGCPQITVTIDFSGTPRPLVTAP